MEDVQPQPLFVDVQKATGEIRTEVNFGVAGEEPPEMGSSSVGTITSLSLLAGDVLDQGDVAFEVNDQAAVVFVSEGPLWRDLQVGDRGADVVRLQRFLRELGHDVGQTDGIYGPALADAVAEFNKAYGIAGDGHLFRRGVTFWVGSATAAVDAVLVSVGTEITVGTPLVSLEVEDPRVWLEVADGQLRDGDKVWFEVGELRLPVDTGATAVTDRRSVDQIVSVLEAAPDVLGYLVTSEEAGAGAIPASAVVTGQDGSTCVFTDLLNPGMSVEITHGTLVSARVPSHLIGTKVLANPREVREDLMCASS